MKWKVGQTVMVQSRTWANINKPGGCAKIVRVHTNRAYDETIGDDEESYVEGLDVKYVLGGGKETNLDPAIVSPYEELERGGRSRRGREFLLQREQDLVRKDAAAAAAAAAKGKPTKRGRRRGRETKDQDDDDDDSSNPKTRAKKTNQQPSTAAAAAAAAPLGTEKNQQLQQQQQQLQEQPPWRSNTPERQRQSRKKQPKRVTPVPKVVLVHNRNEAQELVSPIPMDATGGSSSSSSSHATIKNNKCRQQQDSSAVRGLDFDQGIPSAPPGALLPSERTPKCNETKKKKSAALKDTSNTNTNSKCSKYEETQKQKRPPPTHNPGPSSSKTATATKRNKQGNLPAKTTIKYSSSSSNSKKASFSRATSAYSNSKTTTTKPTTTTKKPPQAWKRPLLDVYRSEVDKARKFMDEMVGGPRIRNDSKTNDCGYRDKAAEATISPRKSRYEEFLSHLHKVWTKIDDEEEISEDNFKSVFQQVSGGSFSKTEVEKHLSAYCDEGKEVVLSNGMLYRV